MVEEEHPAQVVICGGGIVGLVLALALHEHVGVKAEIYERVPEFQEDVGAGMGMYPNGLRVLRDISPSLFDAVRASGHPFLLRRFERHDVRSLVIVLGEVIIERFSPALISCDRDEKWRWATRRLCIQRMMISKVSGFGAGDFSVYFSML
jgi:2-polyprenyl-6-methoxyphenol hydroxylase-like FAD-dependent oxidoreductase